VGINLLQQQVEVVVAVPLNRIFTLMNLIMVIDASFVDTNRPLLWLEVAIIALVKSISTLGITVETLFASFVDTNRPLLWLEVAIKVHMVIMSISK
jgi:hypothetical protein